MKILVLGKGIANDGVVMLLQQEQVAYDYLNINEVKEDTYSYVVKAPGIPYHNLLIQEFQRKGIRVITDIEVAVILCSKFFIGVTGSNGKTTTVSLIAHILSARYEAVACGNIGYSVCRAVVEHPNAEIFVVELSSFQLEHAKIDLNISVLLNVSPCHLDHHESFKEYIQSKANICIHQSNRHYVVYNHEDTHVRAIVRDSMAQKKSFSPRFALANCTIRNDHIYYEDHKIMRIPIQYKDKEHFISDVMAAVSACSLVHKIKPKIIKKGVLTYKEMQYRLTKMNDFVYNDAKSTNPYSTIAAIKCLDSIYLICGGYDRKENLDSLNHYLYKLRKVYAYGQTKDKIYNYMTRHGMDCEVYDTVEEAFQKAVKDRKNENILYSPMFASFDQFENYIARGNYFNQLIGKYLP